MQHISMSTRMVSSGTWTPRWASIIGANIRHLEAMRMLDPKIVGTLETVGVPFPLSLYKVELNKDEDFYYVVGELAGIECIQYGVLVKPIQAIGLKSVKTVNQMSAWEHGSDPCLTGFPRWAFHCVLLPLHGNLLSDKQLSPAHSVWSHRVLQALQSKLPIYVAQMQANQVVGLMPVHSMRDVAPYFSSYSRKPNAPGELFRILISKEVLA